MTEQQIQCDESCPCRTSSCEETCPEYQFQERFSRWLAVQYSDLPLGAHQNIVLNASAIFDDINASNCGDEARELTYRDHISDMDIARLPKMKTLWGI